ncbi:ArnT family glycosyltransferase [Clostridium akagii]|uniref:ArnT family glycosyltransferase n=1 Tax=Clostridium akagii TaxID=91623 RepID=UPI000479E910|nr:glycosyltransferase family 39 protein [Clostridium akagii]
MITKLKRNMSFYIITIITLLALILRLFWILNVPTVPVSDFLQYHRGALSLIDGMGYRVYGHISAYEPVGYSLFLALIYSIFGTSFWVAKIGNLILSCTCLIFIYLIANKSFNKKTACVCALIYGILPLEIIYTSVISTEIIFTTLYVVLLYLMLKRDNTKYNNIILGILLGILTLIKPYMMIYQCLIFLFDIIRLRSFKKPLVNFLIITGVLLLTISPWTIRNYMVFHKFIPVSTNGGYNLYVNNNPNAIGSWKNPLKIHGSLILKYKDKNDDFWDEVKVDEEGKKAALSWIKNNPNAFIKLGFKKVKNTFLTSDSGFWSTDYLSTGGKSQYKNFLQLINKKIHFFTLIIMFVYFSLLIAKIFYKKINNSPIHIMIILNILFFLAVTFMFEGQPRYLFPLWPIFIFAGVYTIKDLIYLLCIILKRLRKAL